MQNTAQPDSRIQTLLKLFFSTLYISAFTFGGGFVIITFMKQKFVDSLHWIDEKEMLDLTALAQSAPGAIAVNAAILVGWRVAGFAGMLTAVMGTILPPMVILSIVSFFYSAFASNLYVALVLKGMQAGVAAVILDVVCSLGENVLKEKSFVSIFIMIAAFVATFFLRVNVVYIILASAMIGICKAFFNLRKERDR
ncbi:MAG: chromate transporter [Oscillospiraceae bacterium]|jgi:chromate transporter|nr:chromate transporter [Oscillospiraceae bacterium]